MRIAMVIAVALVAGTAAAEEPFPMLRAPDTSNPAVSAYVDWHAALVKGDFGAYRSLTPVMPNVSDDLMRQAFDQLRSTAPKTVQVAAPKTNTRGSVEIISVGCNGDRPVVGVVWVGKQSGTWLVGGSGWGPSWNPKISDIVKCP